MADLKLSVVLAAVDKLTGPLRRMSAGSKRTAAAIREAKGALRGLEQQSRKAASQQAMIRRLRELGESSAQARAKVASLQAQILNTGSGTATLKRKLDAAQRSVQRLGQRETDLRHKVKAAGEALRASGYDAAKHGAAMAAAETKVAKLDRRVEHLARQKRILRGLGTAAATARRAGFAAVGIGAAVAAPFVSIIRTAGQFERYSTILETVEGSSAKAKSALAWVSDFAAKTPYQIEGVMDAFVKLRAYGIDPMDGTLRTLGDTAAAMGKDVLQSVEALADAMTGEFERLKEFGIKARAIPGTTQTVLDYVTRAGKQMQVTVDRTNRDMLRKTLLSIWNDKYAGAMDKLSRTWEGMVSNVGDQWTRFKLLVADTGLFDRAKGKLAQILDRINEMAASGELEQLAGKVGKFFADFADGAEKTARVLRVLGTVIGWIGTAFTMVGETIGAGVAGLVISFDRLGTFLSGLWDSVVSYAKQKWDELIDWLAHIPDRIIAIGKQIGAGLAKGIRAGFPDVAKSIHGLGTKIGAWMRQKLDSHSPSRVFAAIGSDIVAGLQLGIRANAAKPLSEITTLSNRMQQSVDRGFRHKGAEKLGPGSAPANRTLDIAEPMRKIDALAKRIRQAGAGLIPGKAAALAKRIRQAGAGLIPGRAAAPAAAAPSAGLDIAEPMRKIDALAKRIRQAGAGLIPGKAAAPATAVPSAGLDIAMPLRQIDTLAKRIRQAGAGIALGGTTALAAAAPASAPASVPQRPAANSGDTYHITINAPAGADARGLAREVERVLQRLERDKAARRRSALYDIE